MKQPLHLCHPKVFPRKFALQLPTENVLFGRFSEQLPFIKDYIQSGGRRFIAVGGDGTVFDLMNGLYAFSQRVKLPFSQFQIGAIAAGSSNDFHKDQPGLVAFGKRRVDFTQMQTYDLLHFSFDQKNYISSLNASLGMTAQANAFFNAPNPLLRLCKNLNMNLAITVSALKAIFAFKNTQVAINQQPVTFSNLAIIKSRFFAGELYYPERVHLDDGKFAVFLIPACSRRNLLQAFSKLRRGEFDTISGGKTMLCKQLEVQAEHEFFLEINGEVFQTKHCQIQILPGAANLCRQ